MKTVSNELEPDAIVWRFMDFTKYVSMLHHRALFFSRADQLPDPFEGTRQNRAAERGEPREQEVREQVYLSCWYQNEHESAAMWRIYLSSEHGVAIRSRVARLESAFSASDEDLYLGRVRYLDYQRERVPNGDELDPFFCKRKHFDYEREVRLLWRERAPSPDTGRYLRADLEALIEQVIISPTAEHWFGELLRSVTEKYGLDLTISESSMLDQQTA